VTIRMCKKVEAGARGAGDKTGDTVDSSQDRAQEESGRVGPFARRQLELLLPTCTTRPQLALLIALLTRLYFTQTRPLPLLIVQLCPRFLPSFCRLCCSRRSSHLDSLPAAHETKGGQGSQARVPSSVYVLPLLPTRHKNAAAHPFPRFLSTAILPCSLIPLYLAPPPSLR
jgi:hypothetical protein